MNHGITFQIGYFLPHPYCVLMGFWEFCYRTCFLAIVFQIKNQEIYEHLLNAFACRTFMTYTAIVLEPGEQDLLNTDRESAGVNACFNFTIISD